MALPILGIVAGVTTATTVVKGASNAISGIKNFVSGIFGGNYSPFNPTESDIYAFLQIASQYKPTNNKSGYFEACKKSGLLSRIRTSGTGWHDIAKPWLEKLWNNYETIVSSMSSNNSIASQSSQSIAPPLQNTTSDKSILMILFFVVLLIFKSK